MIDDKEYPRLTKEICDAYRKRAAELLGTNCADTGSRRLLRKELQKRYGILEMEALDILSGHIRGEVVEKYDMIRGYADKIIIDTRDKGFEKDFIEWIQEREKKRIGEYEIIDEK